MPAAPHDEQQPTASARGSAAGEVVELEDGQRVCLRPLRAEDTARLQALFGRLSPETVRRRFLLPLKALDPRLARHLASVDHQDQEALVAVGECTVDGPIVAVARYARTGRGRAELALVVEDAYQHLGLGRLLLERLATAARAHGISELHGETLPDNEPMLHLLRSTGYPLHTAVANQLYTFTLRLEGS